MGKRRRARELAIQVLYHLEFCPGNPEKGFALVCESLQPSEGVMGFAKELVLGIWENREALDRVIGRASLNWRLERMSHVDRNILRVGAYEILHMEDVPPKVSIDEAVEMGKRYGTEESGAFINGILDNIYETVKGDSSPGKKQTKEKDEVT